MCYPKNMSMTYPPVPVNMTLFENKVFADVVKLLKIILDLDWGQNPMTGILVREQREGDLTQGHTRKKAM